MRRVRQTWLPILLVLGLLASMVAPATAQEEDLPTITIGSKNFTEQFLKSEFVALVLEEAGYPVEREFGLGGTAVITNAILNEDIDMFVEYTGTGLFAVLDEEMPEVDEDEDLTEQVVEIVRNGYAEELDLALLDDLGFNNTYAMAVTQETAEEHDLENTSDLADVADDMTLATDQEFPVRDDGLPGFEEAYGFGFGDVQAGDPGLMYDAVAAGDVDVITAYTTDGRIPALDLVVLEDDLEFFPPYLSHPVVRQALLDEYPEIEDVLGELAGQISEEEMAEVNFQVDEEGESVEDAARAFLEEKGIIEPND